MKRLFIGIAIPDHITDKVLPIQTGIDATKWSKAENLHITLSFIGKVEDTIADKIVKLLRDIRMPKFQLALHGVGTFSKHDKPSFIWLGIKKENELIRLKKQIDTTLEENNIHIEQKPYNPHMTLASLNNSNLEEIDAFLEKHKDLTTDNFEVSEFVLYQSIGENGVSNYQKFKTYSL